jgi:diaminopimelate decarboxylase
MNNYWLDRHPFFKFNNFDFIRYYIQNYSSPGFLYSKKIVTHQYKILRNAIPEKFRIFYAQKSNPNSEILKHLHSLGAGCDTASKGEVKSALEAGFAPNEIMMTGPAKTEAELRFAIENNLLSINVESLQELLLIEKLCAEYSKRQNILIRINPKFEAGETNRIIGGMGVSKFGIDIDFIPQIFEQAKKLRNVEIKGIHIFNSSQILDWHKIYYNIKDVIDTAIRFSREYKLEFELIDAGGGLGIPYTEEEDFLDTEKLGNNLTELVNNSEYREFLSDKTIILEPGRFLSGLAGIYLTKVLYTKKSCGKKILLTDGGIHHLLRPALIRQGHPIINLTAIQKDIQEKEEYLIAGPLCTSLDQFTENTELHKTKPGDILAVLNTGAYGYTESMPLFLSHCPAKEIFLD